MNESAQKTTDAAGSLPQFYRNPVPLEPVRHARAGLRNRMEFGFARGTNAIALTAPEFSMAARSYPIVFSADAPVVPFAVVGLRTDENLFLDAEGQWREDAYIPAYVRRYPFIFFEIADSSRLVLCVDEGADHFEKESDQPFFVDGQPGEGVRRVLKFSETYQAQFEDTRRFGDWLAQNGLLEDRMARVELDDGQIFTLNGFRLVSAEKLRTLDDEKVVELHRKGWLALLNFHQQSVSNWALLSRLARAAKARAA
jgi:hypothetical protein